jgi:SAM-dependent methyltransferase
MTASDPDEHTRRLAAEALASDDPIGWFERLYLAADEGAAVVPWDRDAPHPMLVEWTGRTRPRGAGRRALVVGCGFGRDAEHVAALGYETVAFDVSATAIASARRRHPDSPVHYRTADLLDLPAGWRGGFDLVVESMTVQALPPSHRAAATAAVATTVAPDGTLLVIAVGRGDDEPADGPPWPLTRAEVDAFAAGDLEPVAVEDVRDDADPAVRRWRAELRRVGFRPGGSPASGR